MPTFTCSEPQYEDWRKEIFIRLNQMVVGEIGADVNELSDSILEQQASILASDSTIPALLEIWLRNKNNLEFIWLKQESRVTRCFIMALYPEAIYIPKDRPFPLSAGPNFSYNILRFNKKEKLQRTEEKLFVREHLSEIAKLMIKILDAKNIDKVNLKYKMFQDFINDDAKKVNKAFR